MVSWWPPGPKRTGFWDFCPVSVKNRKRAQRHSRPVEAQNEKPLIVCLPSSRRGLRLLRTLLVLRCHASGAMDTTRPVGRAVRTVHADIVTAWTNSLRSFLGLTSQLRLIGRLEVFHALAFRLDHVCSVQRPASGRSFLALSALCQVPLSFNSAPGYPKFLARHWC